MTSEKVEATVRKIIEVARPVKLILLGSYVRGETNINSDVDILAIASDKIESQRKESIRIRRVL